jgi:hypothetical protein
VCPSPADRIKDDSLENGANVEDQDRTSSNISSHIDPNRPAGNAQFDPRQQTQRMDMPSDAQVSQGEPGRGTAPSRAPDRSHQPHAHESTVQPLMSISAEASEAGRETLPKRNDLSSGADTPRPMIAFVWPSFCALAAAVALNASGRRLLAAIVAPAAPALFLWGLYSRLKGRRPIASRSKPRPSSIAPSPF